MRFPARLARYLILDRAAATRPFRPHVAQSPSIASDKLDVEALRERLQKLSDDELAEFEKDANLHVGKNSCAVGAPHHQ